mgnify:CR=1 FL=1
MGGFRVLDADQFPASRFAPQDGDAGFGEVQEIRQEGAAGGVGGPFHRRCGEPQDHVIWPVGHELVPRRARVHVDRQEDVGTVLSDGGRGGSHLGVAGLSGMAASRRS